MKRIISLFILAVVAISASVGISAEERMLEKISKLPGVESTYIGPAALRLSSSMTTSAGSVGMMKSTVKNLKSVETIECDNTESMKKIKAYLSEVVKKLGLSLIVESRDDEEETCIYARISDTNSIDFILVENFDNEECSIQLINGDIQLSGNMYNGSVFFNGE